MIELVGMVLRANEQLAKSMPFEIPPRFGPRNAPKMATAVATPRPSRHANSRPEGLLIGPVPARDDFSLDPCRSSATPLVTVPPARQPAEKVENRTKYFVLLAGLGETEPWDRMTAEEQQSDMTRHGAFAEACEAKPEVELLGGEALNDGSTATPLRTRNGELTITHGPFAEAAEYVGGYYVLEAPDLDTVIELCRSLLASDIEIRPVLDVS